MPDQLSGGQQQRVAVARAIIGDGDKAPPVLLLDEPLANLDAKLREEMRAELSLLARHSGATTVAVTHDQQEAFALADSVIVLDRGRLAQQGTPRELYDSPHTPFVGAFVGPMAFVPGTLTADALIVGDVRVSLNDVFVAPGVSANEVKVGLRPEWLDVTSDGGLPAVVEQALYLGREHELRTTLLSQPALLRWSTATSPAPKVGDVVRVRPVRAVAFAA